MRAFFAIIVKDLKVRFSSPMELVFFILLPVVFTVVLSGSALSGSGKGKQDPLVLVQDQVASAQSRELLTMLGAMPGVRVREVTDPTALISTSEPELLLSLGPGTTPGTGLPFAVTVRLSPWRGSAATTARDVGEWLRTSGSTAPAVAAAPAASAASAPTAGASTPSALPVIDVPSSAATGNAGQIITWALVPLLGLGAGFITERKRGTMRRVQSTPAPRAILVAASVSAEALGALVQIGLLVSFGTLVFGLPWFSHPVELLLLSAAFCVAGASLGSLLGAVCRTSRQAASLGLAMAMVLAVFGGCWYPSALFPASMKTITGLDPAGWAMDGFLSVLSPSAEAGPALHSAVLLLVFGAGVFLVSAAAARVRRASAA